MAISYYCEREKNSSYLFNGRFFYLTGESFAVMRGKYIAAAGDVSFTVARGERYLGRGRKIFCDRERKNLDMQRGDAIMNYMLSVRRSILLSGGVGVRRGRIIMRQARNGKSRPTVFQVRENPECKRKVNRKKTFS